MSFTCTGMAGFSSLCLPQLLHPQHFIVSLPQPGCPSSSLLAPSAHAFTRESPQTHLPPWHSLISSLRSVVTFLHVTLAKLSLPFFLPCTTVEQPPYAQLCTCERSRSQLRSPPVPICKQAHSAVNVRPSLLRPSACK